MNLLDKNPSLNRLIILAMVCFGLFFGSPKMMVAEAKQPFKEQSHKVSLCHKTNSEKNPYVFLTVSQKAAENGHSEHLEDIFNVSFPEDCQVDDETNTSSETTLTVTALPVNPAITIVPSVTPVPSTTPEPSTTPSPTPQYGDTNICHYTGDITSPYEFVEVSDDATYQMHANHTGDIFDVTYPDDCPTKVRKFLADKSLKTSSRP